MMTQEEAKAYQDKIVADGYELGWYFGTRCKKCCGVYPRFITSCSMNMKDYYRCDVCGKRTEEFEMPWLAEEAWNAGKTFTPWEQLTLQ